MDRSNRVRLHDVLRGFLRAEVKRDRYEILTNALATWNGWMWDILRGMIGGVELTPESREKLLVLRRGLTDPNSLDDFELKLVVRWLGDYGETRIPLIPFTVGCLEDDRSHQVRSWSLQEVPLGELWIEKIDEYSTRILAKHKHNLIDALMELPLDRWGEWRGEQDKNQHPIICLHRKKGGRKGKFWILDGCHRAAAVGRAARELQTDCIKAYVGKWVGDRP